MEKGRCEKENGQSKMMKAELVEAGAKEDGKWGKVLLELTRHTSTSSVNNYSNFLRQKRMHCKKTGSGFDRLNHQPGLLSLSKRPL